MNDRNIHKSALGASLLAAILLSATAAHGQIQLPGANFRNLPPVKPDADGPGGAGQAGRDGQPNFGKPVKLAPPEDSSLAGTTLMHNGRRGSIVFGKGEKLVLEKIVLAGDVISKPGETCQFEVPGGPHALRFSGFSEGLRRYEANIAVCPFSFTVLDGAVVVTHRDSSVSTGLGAGTCVFQDKDCRGYLAGFWGPSGRSFNKRSVQAIEKERGKSEKDARANFRALLGAARGDRKRTSDVAADQAGFSARREERCRDFLREHVHGFCASRITEARAIQLGAKINELLKARADEAEAKRKQRSNERTERRRGQ